MAKPKLTINNHKSTNLDRWVENRALAKAETKKKKMTIVLPEELQHRFKQAVVSQKTSQTEVLINYIEHYCNAIERGQHNS